MNRWIFRVFVLFVFAQTFGQTIKGNITSLEKEQINTANVLIKELNQPENIKEFAIARNGQFSIQLKKEYQNILIEVKSNGFFPLKDSILNPQKNKTYNFNFQLKKDTITKLEEVVVESKRKFKIKEDTISYNVSEYADGTERKIEEIIKKLPGIDVNEKSGEIKYKGKSIETVTLDGDNLFDYNYSLGTKNINVDMVEQIEAIDNYSENPLLKGIEQGGKVSLNLKLKKGKTDISGGAESSTGLFNDGNFAGGLALNLLGVSKTVKSFGTFTYNNVGVNNSPFDYFGFNLNVEQLKEQNVYAQKVIPETLFSNLLGDERSNINDQLFANYNAIFRVNKRLSLKTNLYYLRDEIESNQFYQNDFLINNEAFTTTDNTSIVKNPRQYRLDFELKYNTSKKSLLEYDFRVRQENIKTNTQIIQNGTENLGSNLNSEDFYLKQSLLFTNKLSDKKALQLSIFHSFNNIPQEFNIQPAVLGTNINANRQNSRFRKQFIESKASLLGSAKKGKYSFTLGANFNETPFTSTLFNENSGLTVIENGENDLFYTKKSIFNQGSYRFRFGKWRIRPSYGLTYLYQSLKTYINPETNSVNDILFEPALSVGYRINRISSVQLSSSYNQTPSSEQYFFTNQILTNNRTVINNLPNLDLQNRQNYGINYSNNDLYNQFELNAGLNYNISKGRFFSNSFITENTTRVEYFFLPQSNKSWSANLKLSKYLPFIESTLKLTSFYSLSEYENIVNGSDLRSNTGQFLQNEFFWKTAFDIPVNFENIFNWAYSNSKTDGQSAFENHNLQNTFKILVKPSKKWFLVLASNYYLPNTDSDEDFFFLDATLRHRPKSKRWDASLIFKNITNTENFERVNTSDISTSIYRSNLLPRYFLLNFNWNF